MPPLPPHPDLSIRRFRNPQDGAWHVQLTQGDTYVSTDSEEVLTTILGSCIAACIRDPQLGVGGMNHFLLPEGSGSDRQAMRYGVNAMELLINGILKHGGRRSALEAKLFGGANVTPALSDIGSRNTEFAKKFLEDEGIRLVGGDTGGTSPRRIQYWPSTGRVRQRAIVTDVQRIADAELREARTRPSTPSAAGNDVELF